MEKDRDNLKLDPPGGEKNILLHSCCAPCCGGIITQMLKSDIQPTVLFYNPNIHPKEEYERRKATLLEFLNKEDVPFIDSDYNPEFWFEKTEGLETEIERGARCCKCFEIRLKYSAKFARENGFKVFTSSLGISRWKDMEQVNRAGQESAKKYGVIYWEYNWRKNGGQDLSVEISRQEDFYQQTYCGCKFSLKN